MIHLDKNALIFTEYEVVSCHQVSDKATGTFTGTCCLASQATRVPFASSEALSKIEAMILHNE